MDAPQADGGALREGRGREMFRNGAIIADRRFRRHPIGPAQVAVNPRRG
jgi:hypothetical protein